MVAKRNANSSLQSSSSDADQRENKLAKRFYEHKKDDKRFYDHLLEELQQLQADRADEIQEDKADALCLWNFSNFCNLFHFLCVFAIALITYTYTYTYSCTHDQAVDLINANFVMSGKTINLSLKNIHGDNLSRLSIESTALCAHVAANVAATKKGCIAMLMAGQMYLKLDCSLEQQGVTEDADITCVFTNVTSAQYNKVIHAFEQHPGQELQGEDFAIWHSLTSLALTHVFNQSLDNVSLPVNCVIHRS